MTKCNTSWLLILTILAGCTVAGAQQTSQSQAAPAAAENSQQKNIQEYIDLLRSDVRHRKAEIMGAVMDLNADQAAKFWPIYNQYDKELAKLSDLRLANIQAYAQNYDHMTDAKANELVQNAFAYHKQRTELLARYYDRVKASLGAIEAARFVQIEDQLLNIIDLQIASHLPVVPQGS
jgi:predicted negative regulator of RcsB-dependent stress response